MHLRHRKRIQVIQRTRDHLKYINDLLLPSKSINNRIDDKDFSLTQNRECIVCEEEHRQVINH